MEAACSDISEEEDEEEEQQRDSVDNTRAQHYGPTDSSVSSRHTSIDFDVDYLIPFGRSGIQDFQQTTMASIGLLARAN